MAKQKQPVHRVQMTEGKGRNCGSIFKDRMSALHYPSSLKYPEIRSR